MFHALFRLWPACVTPEWAAWALCVQRAWCPCPHVMKSSPPSTEPWTESQVTLSQQGLSITSNMTSRNFLLVCLFVLTKLILDILYPNCQVAASRFKESFLLKYSCCLSSTGDDFFPPFCQLILLLAVFSTVLNVLSEPLQSVLVVAAKSNSSIWHHLCKDHWLKKHKTDIYFC